MQETLIDTATVGGIPAPIWFIELFKWLGFTLHEVPMNLWYAGIIVSMFLHASGNEHGRRFGARLITQMPVIIALGINFGIVPLLFIQVGFGQVFYPATILMAWFWFAVVVLLVPAYYGVYLYSYGLAGPSAEMPRWKQTAGWLSALLFIVIGFIFANAMSLMENLKAWPDLWQQHSFHGAAVGTALNVADSRLWPRWLLMFGLALTTTAAWMAFDSAWFAGRESPAYHGWAIDFAWKLYTFGAAWFALAGAWYSIGAWTPETQRAMFQSTLLVLTVATAAAPGLVWVLLYLARKHESGISIGWASLIGLAQFGMLGVNAASRQVVQHLEFSPYFDVWKQPTATQWAPLLIFLVVFVLGLALVAWMICQVCRTRR